MVYTRNIITNAMRRAYGASFELCRAGLEKGIKTCKWGRIRTEWYLASTADRMGRLVRHIIPRAHFEPSIMVGVQLLSTVFASNVVG